MTDLDLGLDLGKAYVSQAILLSQHELDKRIRFRQEEAESIFGSLMNAQSVQTNIPDDMDPSAPRLFFQSNTKQLQLSQTAIQAVLGFHANEKPLNEQLEIINKNFLKFSEVIPKFQNITGESGLVITVNIPANESRAQLSSNLFSSFLKLPHLHPVASTSFKVGFQTSSGLFLNFEADVYELRKFLIEAGSPKSIDLNEGSPDEQGFSFKIDINNKPRNKSRATHTEETQLIFNEMFSFLREEFPALVRLSQAKP